MSNKEPEKKKFEVRMQKREDGTLEKAIFIDGELLDWSIDMSSYLEAMKMGPMYRKEIQESIARHFVEAVSDTLGRHVTVEDIKKATQTGWI